MVNLNPSLQEGGTFLKEPEKFTVVSKVVAVREGPHPDAPIVAVLSNLSEVMIDYIVSEKIGESIYVWGRIASGDHKGKYVLIAWDTPFFTHMNLVPAKLGEAFTYGFVKAFAKIFGTGFLWGGITATGIILLFNWLRRRR